MPRAELMTWIASQKQWTKRHRGRRYYISTRQLGTAPTKDASLAAANDWWRNKQGEIEEAYRANQTPPRTPQPMEDVVAALTGGIPWTSLDDVAKAAVAFLNKLPPSREAEALAERVEEAAYAEAEEGDVGAWEEIAARLGKLLLPALLERSIQRGEPLPDALKERLPPARVHQIESALKGLRGEAPAETDRSVKTLSEAWLQRKQTEVKYGEMTATRLASLRVHMAKVTAFIGEGADVGTIDGEKVEGLFYYCRNQMGERHQNPGEGWSAAYAREVFGAAKCWMRWLWERGTIELPKNLESRSFSFGSRAKKIQTWTVDEVRAIVCKATGKLKLCLLLCLNIGATQKDVSDLLDSEVDWRAGRIIRRRSKTSNRKDTPEVNYKLWPSTFALLNDHRSGKDRVVLTKSGKPFVNRRLVDGEFHAVDSFGDLFRRFAKKNSFKKPMKLLRKTSASLLESHETYGRFTSLFLGHSPKSMKDRHYAAPPQELFDAAVTWLGEKLEVAVL